MQNLEGVGIRKSRESKTSRTLQLNIKLRPVRLAEPRAEQTQKVYWEEVSAEATASSNRKSFSVLLSPHEV